MIRNEIGNYFCLKEEYIGDPGQCFGVNLREVVLENGARAWSFCSKQYVKAAVNNVVGKAKPKSGFQLSYSALGRLSPRGWC